MIAKNKKKKFLLDPNELPGFPISRTTECIECLLINFLFISNETWKFEQATFSKKKQKKKTWKFCCMNFIKISSDVISLEYRAVKRLNYKAITMRRQLMATQHVNQLNEAHGLHC